jgi:hypothetical protein
MYGRHRYEWRNVMRVLSWVRYAVGVGGLIEVYSALSLNPHALREVLWQFWRKMSGAGAVCLIGIIGW